MRHGPLVLLALGRGVPGHFFCLSFLQKLLEECEQNREKVEECHHLAKQYIDAIKVRGRDVCSLEGGLALQAGLPCLGSGAWDESTLAKPSFCLRIMNFSW